MIHDGISNALLNTRIECGTQLCMNSVLTTKIMTLNIAVP